MESRIIIGLGNPGKKYEATRHNLGFLAVERLARHFKIVLSKNETYQGMLGQKIQDDNTIGLFLPLTFVDNSGSAVLKLAKKKRISTDNILVVCDDLNLDFGQLRLKTGGSDGGHHGLQSIINALSDDRFARLRLGIGRPEDRNDVVDYVLTPFTPEEKRKLPALLEKAAECCAAWLSQGAAKAMNQFNKRPPS